LQQWIHHPFSLRLHDRQPGTDSDSRGLGYGTLPLSFAIVYKQDPSTRMSCGIIRSEALGTADVRLARVLHLFALHTKILTLPDSAGSIDRGTDHTASWLQQGSASPDQLLPDADCGTAIPGSTRFVKMPSRSAIRESGMPLTGMGRDRWRK